MASSLHFQSSAQDLSLEGYTHLPRRTPRDYQEKLIASLQDDIKSMLRTKRHKAGKQKPHYPINSSSLLESATWSGKTFTIGTNVCDLWTFKERYNAINRYENGKLKKNINNPVFPDFNILVLNDRIGLVEQLRQEFIEGEVKHDDKTIKAPICEAGWDQEDDRKTQYHHHWWSGYHHC